MREIVLALTTLPANVDPGPLARGLVEAGVAACVSVIPGVRSIYTWRGEVQDDAEQQLIIKTTRDRVNAAWTELKSRHPYDVPEFLVLPVVDGNPDYMRWISESMDSGQR